MWGIFSTDENSDCAIVNGREVCMAGTVTNGYFLQDIEPIIYYAFFTLFFNQMINEF